jgi:hypothetical protein
VRMGLCKLLREVAPMPLFAHQATQQYPGHGRYQRCTARSCRRRRVGPCASHS